MCVGTLAGVHPCHAVGPPTGPSQRGTAAARPCAVRDKADDARLCRGTSICKRNRIKKLRWSTSKNNRVCHLNGGNMTVHHERLLSST